MTELLTAAQMRAIEQAAIDSAEVTGLELMERAGQGVVDAIFEEWPELAGEGGREVEPTDTEDKRGPAPAPPRYLDQEEKRLRAVVLCGPGNNGGDGFVVARLLHQRGWAVEVFLYGDAEKLPPDARANYERWSVLGAVKPIGSFSGSSDSYDIIIDALFGTGLTRGLSGVLRNASNCLKMRGIEDRARLIAIDFPSGLCSDSGRDLGGAVASDLTVSFHGLKLGHVLESGPYFCGLVKTVSIGIEETRYPTLPGTLARLTGGNSQSLGKGRARRKFEDAISTNKFSHGHAFILSGAAGHTGAARLAARGALRIGAGLVTLGAEPAALPEAAAQLTAIMLKQVADADGLTDVLQDKRIIALCLGPALGLGRAKPLVSAALDAGLDARPTVLDADALSAFEDQPDALFAMLHEKCVLTPHGGEFARLFPDIAEKLNATPTKGPAYSKVDATREAAKRAGCVVLFKGPDTVIAAPDGRCSINSAHYERSAPWLATAGSGDVLAGFITGLLARGFEPMPAAETAAWLHVECALKFGPGLIAEDIPEQLPAVFRDLGL